MDLRQKHDRGKWTCDRGKRINYRGKQMKNMTSVTLHYNATLVTEEMKSKAQMRHPSAATVNPNPIISICYKSSRWEEKRQQKRNGICQASHMYA